MLQSLFRRAEAKVDDVIAQMLARVAIALPFVIAAGFGTAALAIALYANFGLVIGNLILAGVFCVVGLIVAAVVAIRQRAADEDELAASTAAAPEGGGQQEEARLFDVVDREVMGAVASAVAPFALPVILRPVMRNLPLVAAIAAAGFVLTRKPETEAGAREMPMQPAE
jgi:hypothetical protein